MKITCVGVFIVVLSALFAAPSMACDGGNVREVALKGERDDHILCVIANRDDASAGETYDRLAKWLVEKGGDLNIRLERLEAQDANVRWEDYGMPSAPPTVPVTALVGRFVAQRHAFVIDHWEPGPTDEELAALLASPARDAMKERITEVWATLLYAPGTTLGNSSQPGVNVDAVLEAVSKKWAAEQPPGIAVVRFDRADPKERVLRAFTGIREEGPNWLAIVYGKGKLMAPPLEGADITEDNLNRLLEALAVPCTCLAEVTVQGVDIPMTWGDDLDALVASQVVSMTGYTELTLSEATVPGPGGVPVTPEVKERLDKEIAVLEKELPGEKARMWASVLLPLVTVAALGLGMVMVVLSRKERREKIGR